MSRNWVNLSRIETTFGEFFKVKDLETDPAFSRFLPMAYDSIGFDWRGFFEPPYVGTPEKSGRFNGILIKGTSRVKKVWAVSFPSEEVLGKILERAQDGDFIFSHHPVNMLCGDPGGKMGTFVEPIKSQTLQQIKDMGLSFYSCHAPLDTNDKISTSIALANLMQGKVVETFLPYGLGDAGLVCEIVPRS